MSDQPPSQNAENTPQTPPPSEEAAFAQAKADQDTQAAATEQATRGPIASFNAATWYIKIMVVLGAVGAIFILLLIVSLFVGIVLGQSEGVANMVAVLRDLFIILLAMQGMLISLALIVMILQFATMIHLIQNEVKPVLKNLQDTSQTVKGTSDFIGENLSTPIIESQAWMVGLRTFATQLNPLRRADTPPEAQAQSDTTPPPPDEPPPQA